MRHELRELILSVLLDPHTMQRGYFDVRGVRQLLDEHFSGRRNHSGRIWRLLMFELWHRNFLRKLPAANCAGESGSSAAAWRGRD
jgi:asparagine synthase (glutamine-hydrolysing)